jgi:flagellar assembly factor FliW
MKTLELTETQKHELDGENVIQLPYGLLGFEQAKNYLLLAKPGEEPFLWLKMTGGKEQSFLVVCPFVVKPDYRPDIAAEDADFLGLEQPEDALVFNIVTLRPNGQATVNLKGPIVINRHSRIGKQVIPNNAAQYNLRQPLPVS